MKKNTILSIMTCAAMLLLTAACSNDENSNPKEQPTQAVQFSFTNEDFGADETLSRATGAAEAKGKFHDEACRLSPAHPVRLQERYS